MRIPVRRGGLICDFDRTVTPMVDVVFQLLVFFVLASGGRVVERALPAALPAGISGGIATPQVADRGQQRIWIHLQAQPGGGPCAVLVHGRRYADWSQLSAAIATSAPDRDRAVAILDVDDGIAWEDVIHAQDACRSAGLRTICFAASPEDLGAGGRGAPRPTPPHY